MTQPSDKRLLTEANAALLYAPKVTVPTMPHYATVGRPDPVVAGKGAHVFDDDLNKPIVSDGAVWRDFVGTAV